MFNKDITEKIHDCVVTDWVQYDVMGAAIAALNPYDDFTWNKYLAATTTMDSFNWRPCMKDDEVSAMVGEWTTFANDFWSQEDATKKVEENVKDNYEAIVDSVTKLQKYWNTGELHIAGFYWGKYWSLLMGGKPEPAIPDEPVALPPIDSVPDFTAGLIYGFTGNDHRVELEGCMTDTTTVVDDAKTFVDDIKGLELLQGIKDAGKIIWDLPNATESCEKLGQLQDDINSMLGWAEIIKTPTQAVKVASKNWLFHGVEIKKDIADEQADYEKKDYYSAGQDTASALLRLIPLSTEEEHHPIQYDDEMLAQILN